MKKTNNSEIEGKTQNKGGVISEPLKLQYDIKTGIDIIKTYEDFNLEEVESIIRWSAWINKDANQLKKLLEKGE